MSLELGGVTSHLVSLALDAALVRHEVIAGNIANCHTPGYRAKRLSFESLLGDMQTRIEARDHDAFVSRLERLRDDLQNGGMTVESEDEAVELDREMVRLTENALRYQAILKAAAKQGQLLRSAINGGRQ